MAGKDATPDSLVDLMGQVAHDLNNQLATILGKSEIAMMVDDPARWRSAVEESHKAGQKARVLVADFQKLHGWHRDQGASPAPLSDVIGLLRRVCERRLTRSAVILEPAHAPSRVLTDPVRVFMLLWLALSEALERGGSDISATWTLAGREDAPGGAWSMRLAHPGASLGQTALEGPSRRLEQMASIATSLEASFSVGSECVDFRFGA